MKHISLIFKTLPLLLLLSCGEQGTATNTANSDLTLQTYEVPDNMGEQLVRMLNRSFRPEEGINHGRAELMPNGQVVVLTTTGIHKGMKDIIHSLQNVKSAPITNTTLDVWFVLSQKSEDNTVGEGLANLQEILIQSRNDPHSYHLLEKLRLKSAAGVRATIRGNFFIMNNVLSPKGEHTLADLDIDAEQNHNRMNATLVLKDGQYMIVGQSKYFYQARDTNDESQLPTGIYELLIVIKSKLGS